MPHCADCNSWLSDRYAERGNPPQNDDGDVICAVCAGVYDDDDDDRPVAKPDGGVQVDTTALDHGEIKRRIAEQIGSDPSRYATGIGTERHKILLDDEVTLICEDLGIGFLADQSKQERQDAIMLKLGRDHRTGAGMFDSSDLVAILQALEGGGGRSADRAQVDPRVAGLLVVALGLVATGLLVIGVTVP